MLTHRNILANVDAISQVFQLKNDDVMVGVLPFFHSFGFSVTLWLPMSRVRRGVPPTSMDGKTIGEIAAKYRGSILVSTPPSIRDTPGSAARAIRSTFATRSSAPRSSASRSRPRSARSRHHADRRLWRTEMSPVVAVNAPDVDEQGGFQRGSQAGTVGHPLPGVVAKVVDLETGEGPLIGKEGCCW